VSRQAVVREFHNVLRVVIWSLLCLSSGTGIGSLCWLGGVGLAMERLWV